MTVIQSAESICETIRGVLKDLGQDYINKFRDEPWFRHGVINVSLYGTVFSPKDEIEILNYVETMMMEDIKALNRWALLPLTDDDYDVLKREIKEEICENIYLDDNPSALFKLEKGPINFVFPYRQYPLNDEDFDNLKNYKFKPFIEHYVDENLDDIKAFLKTVE